MYFVVERTFVTKQRVIVKARSVYEAFQNAGDDVHCNVIDETEGDLEPIWNSISKTDYVSKATKEKIEK